MSLIPFRSVHAAGLALALVTTLPVPGVAQQDDVGSRGWFVGSRPQTPAPAARHPRHTTPGAKPTPTPPAAPATGPLGVGYTIFKEVPGARPVRVEPTVRFAAGTAVRLVVESNADAYVYLFDAEDGTNPVMLYPDARLEGGENFVGAHVPIEIPSSHHPNFQWFRFTGGPATEQLVLVVATEPLTGVPTGADLVRYWEAKAKPWQPEPDEWRSVAEAAKSEHQKSESRSSDDRQTDEEATAVARGMTLSAAAPPPSVIAVNPSGNARLVVTRIAFVHD